MDEVWDVVSKVDDRLEPAGSMRRYVSKKQQDYYRIVIRGVEYLAFKTREVPELKQQEALKQ